MKIFPYSHIVCSLFGLASVAVPGNANTSSATVSTSILELEAYVITANRTPTDIANVSQAMDVVRAEEINLVSASFGTDLLKKTTSVDVIQYPGGTSGISLRGFRPEYSNETNPHTLLLINGRPVSSSHGNIPTTSIERIEVLKGPASAIYGPSAMGGVINIITKQSEGSLSGNLFAGYGSFQTTVGGIGAGGSLSEKWRVDVSLDWTDRGKDYTFGNGDSYEVGAKGKKTYLNTQFTRLNGLIRMGYQVSEAWNFDVMYDFSDQTNTGVPGSLSNQKYGASNPSVRDLWRQGWSIDFGGKHDSHRLSSKIYSNYLDSFQTYSADSFSAAYRGRTNRKEITEWGVQLNDMWSFDDRNDLVIGADHGFQKETNLSRNADGSVRTFYKPDYDRVKTGVFTEWITRLVDENVILNIGGRVDRIKTTVASSSYEGTTYLYKGGSQTFDQFSPRAGLVWKINPSWRIHSSIGTAFIAPNAEEIAGYYESEYSNYMRVNKGNPNLDPESSITWDIGLEYNSDRFKLDVTYFQTQVEDYIITLDTGEREPPGDNGKERRLYSYVNADSQGMRGIEFTGSIELEKLMEAIPGQLQLAINGTYMSKAEVKSGTYTEPVKNIADWKGNLSINWHLGEFSSRFNSRYNGKRWDIDYTYDDYYGGDWMEYSDSWVFDWSISWRYLPHHKISLLVDNLLDTYYYEKHDYPQEGRNFMLRYEFEF
ncbi:MAG: TonB-dependent receptor [Opitutales bacterium]|nr:TonB-dependent receptor [Opitutales bacterium]